MGAVYWHADMDIDCDGQPSTECNSSTDPWFQPQTSAVDFYGEYLDAASLPFIVIPSVSWRFDYSDYDIELGSVGAIIYDDQVLYAIFGDQGPQEIIGEASYAAAEQLGIDPDPAVGGTADQVTYIVFSGASGVVQHNEDHAEATAVGIVRAMQLTLDN